MVRKIIKILRRYSRVVQIVLLLSFLAVGVAVLNGQKSELSGAFALISRAKITPIIFAVLSECLSIVTFGIFNYLLLKIAVKPLGWIRPTVISMAATTLNNSIPGGAAVSSVYAFRQYRELGADRSFSTWVVVAVNILSGLALASLALLGVALSFRISQGLDLIFVIVSISLGLLVLAAGISNPKFIVRVERTFVEVAYRLTSMVRRDTGGFNLPSRHYFNAKPTLSNVISAITFALLNWIFDAAVLVLAYVSIGQPVPWAGLLLAYGAGQLAANFPITPGGLGVVEGSLAIALVAYGGAQESAVAAVLIYRLISYWMTMPFGWVAYAYTVLKRNSRNSQTSMTANGCNRTSNYHAG